MNLPINIESTTGFWMRQSFEDIASKFFNWTILPLEKKCYSSPLSSRIGLTAGKSK